ncbi:MAG TPA: 50S ribosomal protein L9 [Candidatus Magasanikbacteria bacterium]|nr:50S ribosomal protein L9 [Candidatus Magasanikbacteria bacterium]
MKLIFQKEVQGVAKIGEIKEIANGFARNYLIPRGLAVQVSESQINAQKDKVKRDEKKREKDLKGKEVLAKRVDGAQVIIKAEKKSGDTLYSAIGAGKIAEAIVAQLKFKVSAADIVLDTPIKSVGAHEAKIKFAPTVFATVRVIIS